MLCFILRPGKEANFVSLQIIWRTSLHAIWRMQRLNRFSKKRGVEVDPGKISSYRIHAANRSASAPRRKITSTGAYVPPVVQKRRPPIALAKGRPSNPKNASQEARRYSHSVLRLPPAVRGHTKVRRSAAIYPWDRAIALQEIFLEA